jgi:hypothetical protein
MKVDVIRKLPEHLDTLILMQEEGGKAEQIEYLPTGLTEQVETFVKAEEFSFASKH